MNLVTPDELDAIADQLSPSQQHVLLRCSDAGFWFGPGIGCWREWVDVVAGRPNCGFRSVRPLERCGLVVTQRFDGIAPSMVALTRLGLRVQATLRLRGETPRSP